VPKEATIEEIEQAYIDSWRIGAKAVSIYRDGSKRTQPLNTSRDKEKVAAPAVEAGPRRRRLPDERAAITHKFDIAGHEGYITVGLYEDGLPGELFIVMAKEGSTISGFADAFAQAISYALQYGVPLQDLVDKFSHVRFEPSGMTRNPDVRFAKSIVDYIFRWMASKFLSQDVQYRVGVNNREEVVTSPEQLPLDVAAAAGAAPTGAVSSKAISSFAAIQNQEDAPPCSTCGSIMVRSGACYKCSNCGTTSGCA
jgi:ribonucleoside-diphosphate reductase alpha chain